MKLYAHERINFDNINYKYESNNIKEVEYLIMKYCLNLKKKKIKLLQSLLLQKFNYYSEYEIIKNKDVQLFNGNILKFKLYTADVFNIKELLFNFTVDIWE